MLKSSLEWGKWDSLIRNGDICDNAFNILETPQELESSESQEWIIPSF